MIDSVFEMPSGSSFPGGDGELKLEAVEESFGIVEEWLLFE